MRLCITESRKPGFLEYKSSVHAPSEESVWAEEGVRSEEGVWSEEGVLSEEEVWIEKGVW